MRYYDETIVRRAIERILAPEWTPNPHMPDETRVDRLVHMFSTMTDNCYGAGMREVQQGVIKALDLRHLLGGGR